MAWLAPYLSSSNAHPKKESPWSKIMKLSTAKNSKPNSNRKFNKMLKNKIHIQKIYKPSHPNGKVKQLAVKTKYD